MRNNRGFTLVELLVAATIIGALVVFASVGYRNSVAEARWTQAKAKADYVGSALQNFWVDYPYGTGIAGGTLLSMTENTNCILRYGKLNGAVSTVQLIACGYLDNGDWSTNQYYQWVTCKNTAGAWPGCSAALLACVLPKSSGADSKLPAKYRNKYYCVGENGVGTEGTF